MSRHEQKKVDVIGINIPKTKLACSSGATGRTKNCKCKESTIHIRPPRAKPKFNKESSAGELLRFNRATVHSNLQEMNNTEVRS